MVETLHWAPQLPQARVAPFGETVTVFPARRAAMRPVSLPCQRER